MITWTAQPDFGSCALADFSEEYETCFISSQLLSTFPILLPDVYNLKNFHLDLNIHKVGAKVWNVKSPLNIYGYFATGTSMLSTGQIVMYSKRGGLFAKMSEF